MNPDMSAKLIADADMTETIAKALGPEYSGHVFVVTAKSDSAQRRLGWAMTCGRCKSSVGASCTLNDVKLRRGAIVARAMDDLLRMARQSVDPDCENVIRLNTVRGVMES